MVEVLTREDGVEDDVVVEERVTRGGGVVDDVSVEAMVTTTKWSDITVIRISGSLLVVTPSVVERVLSQKFIIYGTPCLSQKTTPLFTPQGTV